MPHSRLSWILERKADILFCFRNTVSTLISIISMFFYYLQNVDVIYIEGNLLFPHITSLLNLVGLHATDFEI
jgi:hypothetical protein